MKEKGVRFSIRRFWKRKPQTKIKQSKKIYSRSSLKQALKEELSMILGERV